MPWFPDFASAVELARRQTRAAGQADPVTQYFELLNSGDTRPLETVWPGEITVLDPLAGQIRGHRELHRFVRQNQSWLGGLHARTDRVAQTAAGGRAVVELLAHVRSDGADLAWPVAVIAESPDGLSVVFRTYCRVWPITGPHRVRPAILPAGAAGPGDVVGRYCAALAAGDTEAIVATFAPDGYYQEASGPQYRHQGAGELRAFFGRVFGAGGGVGIEPDVVTDDGVRCAVEYTCARWGSHELPPQAGLLVAERGPDGRLAAVRGYDDIAAPAAGN
jgi:SnoaL-like domain